ncbi:MAG: SHOCT domain-containing protein [Gemmatimonadetes bacterium]|nr:SHOCT domain-containing protein [Gemmatimonadota bacterium]
MNAFAVPMAQMSMPWHNGGLLMGMHWLWWTFWLVTLAALFLAFWRLHAERSQMRRDLADEERAEETLRRRYARGEIGDEEYARKLKVLRETMLGR